jgi:predicted nucleic acid-binding protein
MSARFFIDTTVFVYAVRESDAQPGAAATLAALGAGTAEAVTSAAVLQELWRLELKGRIPELAGVTEAVFTLLRPVLAVTDDIMETAFGLRVREIGANDRVHLATCMANGVSTILSGDRGFDAAPGIRRVDPADLAEVRQLLARA